MSHMKLQTKRQWQGVVLPIFLLFLLGSKLTFKDHLFALLWGDNERAREHTQVTAPRKSLAEEYYDSLLC